MTLRATHVVVVGTSSGGLETLRVLVSRLPADFPAPICIVMHMGPRSPRVLADILSRAGSLPATYAVNSERLRPSHIYIAPPDCHLLVEPGKLRVTKGPKENRFRPAVDPLFRSAAQVYGPNAIGVVLTGSLDDGTAGLWAIKQLGGVAIVQDPRDALFPDMPANAMEFVSVDHVVRASEIAPALVRLTSQPADEGAAAAAPREMEVEVKIAKEEDPLAAGWDKHAQPSSFACPECHGVLLQLKEGERLRFRCHTGHAYSAASLMSAVNEGIEDSLWSAMRSLHEGAMLVERMAEHVKSHSQQEAATLKERAAELRRQADDIRTLVMSHEPVDTAAKP